MGQGELTELSTLAAAPTPGGYFLPGGFLDAVLAAFFPAGAARFTAAGAAFAAARPLFFVPGVEAATCRLKAVPTLKPTLRVAPICRTCPVPGLRPSRAARSRASKVPNPGRVTFSPAVVAPTICSSTAFSVASTCARGSDVALVSDGGDKLSSVHQCSLNTGGGPVLSRATPGDQARQQGFSAPSLTRPGA